MLLSPEIDQYIERHTSAEPEVLQKLTRETHLNVMHPQMLSGQVQGAFLTMLSQLMRPQRVLEIGTYTGYSAICLAQGMPENGKLFTIDINEELTPMVKKYIAEAGLEQVVIPMTGNAHVLIEQVDAPLDLVFIDADKASYPQYYDLVFDKVRPGGYIIADNVLWYGKVIDKEVKDKDTEALRVYNAKVQADERVDNVLLSIRDGLLVARKKEQ